MPFVELRTSPHAEGVSPVTIHYRDIGTGPPLVFLHGGWGYGVYPIDRQIEALSSRVRFLIPSRSGHARSTPFAGPLPLDTLLPQQTGLSSNLLPALRRPS